MTSVFDSLFSPAQEAMLTVFGMTATYYANNSDAGTSCTVMLERRGGEDTGYGTQQAAVVIASRDVTGDDPTPGYAFFDIDGETWTIDLILGTGEGSTTTDLALLCSGGRRYGMEA